MIEGPPGCEWIAPGGPCGRASYGLSCRASLRLRAESAAQCAAHVDFNVLREKTARKQVLIDQNRAFNAPVALENRELPNQAEIVGCALDRFMQ